MKTGKQYDQGFLEGDLVHILSGQCNACRICRYCFFVVFAWIMNTTGAFGQPVIWADSCNSSSFYGKLNGMGNSVFTKTVAMPGGDIIAVGTVQDMAVLPVKKEFGLVARISGKGELIWKKIIGSTAPLESVETKLRAVAITKAGDIVLPLNLATNMPAENYIIKLDGNGNLLWQKHLPYIVPYLNKDVFTEILETADDGFFIAGTAADRGAFLKLDAAGEVKWRSMVVQSAFYISVNGIAEGDERYYIAGQYRDFYYNYVQNYMLGVNKYTGNIESGNGYNFHTDEVPMGFAEYDFTDMKFKDGILTITGSTKSDYRGTNKPAQVLLKVDEYGHIISSSRIENGNISMQYGDQLYGAYYDPITQTGLQFKESDTSDIYLYRLDASGNKEWAWKVAMSEKQFAHDMRVNVDSSVVVAGKSSQTGSDSTAIIFKLTHNGKLDACNNIDYGIKLTALSPETISPNGLAMSTGISIPTEPSALEINNANAMNWQLTCNSGVFCKISKIDGAAQLCTGVTYHYKVSRGGGCNMPVSFSSDAPATITYTSDTSADITITRAGAFKLHASMGAACGILKDSLALLASDPGAAFSLGPDRLLCPGNSILLPGPAGFTNYRWQDGSNNTDYLVTIPGKYYLTTHDACGNTFSDTVNITGVVLTGFNLGPDREKCNNDTLHLNGPAGYSNYQWSPNYKISSIRQQNVVVNPQVTTAYMLKAEKFAGCWAFDTINVIVKQSPKIELGPDTLICQDATLLLNAGAGFDTYFWNNIAGAPVYTVSREGVYHVMAYASNGCHSSDSIKVQMQLCLDDMYIPNAFTPNQDGKNDIFKPMATLPLLAYHFTVYNRWGTKIFESNDINQGWDGLLGGQVQDPGVFVWICQYQFAGRQPQKRKGTVILLK